MFQLRKDLVDQLMGVKFQGSLLLDSSIKVSALEMAIE